MSSPQELHPSIVRVLRSLAKQHNPPADGAFNGQAAGLKPIVLDGSPSEEKADLERELTALQARIDYLEAKAKVVDSHTFPMTPGEPTTSQFVYPNSAPDRSGDESSEQPARRESRDRATWVNNWLASRETNGTQDVPAAALTEEQLNYLRDHLNKQADQIKNQREHIDNLSAEVNKQLNNQSLAFEHGIEDIGALKRELGKHQQANLAFQKALREIGNIVTAVAMGDLSKKVLIHAKEMDPEIMNFKRTINKMVDQLQEFASQVTNLAKEVGTEGRLGGQANLPGVDGIWAELTDSGMLHPKPETALCAFFDLFVNM
jgi:osomolarity two-component system sensor histidine kinase NIK1